MSMEKVKFIDRELKFELPQGKSMFLWGPRKTGKTHWIKRQFKESFLIDLLQSEVFADDHLFF